MFGARCEPLRRRAADAVQMAARSDEHEYLDLVKLILETGTRKSDRTGWRAVLCGQALLCDAADRIHCI